jgi:ABC-type branched-subunit amino acid transport system substrate-binding protein
LYTKGYRRIGFLGQADAYGMSGKIGVRDAMGELNLKIVASVTYWRNQPFETSLSEEAGILRQAGADAVIAVGVYGPCAAFIRDARAAGWNVPIANVSFVGSERLLEKLREASKLAKSDLTRDLINSQVVPSPDDLRVPLVADFRAHNPAETSGFISLEGWLNAVVATEALRRSGPTATREDFTHALESLHGWDPGLGIPLEFSPTTHQGLHKIWLTRTENAHWVPAEAAGTR